MNADALFLLIWGAVLSKCVIGGILSDFYTCHFISRLLHIFVFVVLSADFFVWLIFPFLEMSLCLLSSNIRMRFEG